MTDIAIVGKGPAGWSCAMTARMRGLSATVIAPANDAGLLRAAERIDNYPGMPHASGESMLESFRSQALELGAEERAGLVRQIMPTESGFMLLVENDVMDGAAGHGSCTAGAAARRGGTAGTGRELLRHV